jgi:hypothetical protein
MSVRPVIIDLRGTNGSGKSTIAGVLIEELEGNQVYFRGNPVYCDEDISGYEMAALPAESPEIFVVGPYRTPTGGGCDTIQTQEEICGLVRCFANFGSVLFEGSVVSTIYQRYADLATELSAPTITFSPS